MSYHDFQPGDGTRYILHTIPSEHGGILVINHESSLWRYHRGDCVKFLCGNFNEYTQRAIWDYLEGLNENQV